MTPQHLNQPELTERWGLSRLTIEQWRWQGKGPRYLKLGGRVAYPIVEIEAFEASSLHANTVGPIAGRPEDDCRRDRR